MGVLLFVLFSGALPFASYDRDEMDRMVLEEDVSFEDEAFNGASKAQKTLILWMLNKDRKKRPTIHQVLEDTFLQGTVLRVTKKNKGSPRNSPANKI
jgi:hypothetical protein